MIHPHYTCSFEQVITEQNSLKDPFLHSELRTCSNIFIVILNQQFVLIPIPLAFEGMCARVNVFACQGSSRPIQLAGIQCCSS